MTIFKPLNNMIMLTPYEQYFIQTLHQEGRLIPKQSPGGKKNPFSSLLLTPPTHHLKKPVKQLPSYRTRSAMLPLSEPQTTTTTGTYCLIRLTYIIDPTY